MSLVTLDKIWEFLGCLLVFGLLSLLCGSPGLVSPSLDSCEVGEDDGVVRLGWCGLCDELEISGYFGQKRRTSVCSGLWGLLGMSW